MTEPKRLLILGGTTEAAALARRLADRPELEVITSLAGRTRAPAALPGQVRTGGFGGIEGLASYLSATRIDLLVDATHPFAAVMPHHAAAACDRAAVPRLRLLRPAWQAAEGERWTRVPDLAAAAQALAGQAARVFLATGRQGIGAFSDLEKIWFLVRLIERPDEPLPLKQHTLILARGPFAEDQERALLADHRIDTLVSKNSGGTATYAKLAAARALALPVVMIERPPQPPGATAAEVEAAVDWVQDP